MEIVILDSVLKHGVTKDRIFSCLYNVRGDEILDGYLHKRMVAGFDHLGNALEVATIEDKENDRLVVIHAMKLRKQFYYLLGDDYEL